MATYQRLRMHVLFKNGNLPGHILIPHGRVIGNLDGEDDAPLELRHGELQEVAVISEFVTTIAAVRFPFNRRHWRPVRHRFLESGLHFRHRVLPSSAHALPTITPFVSDWRFYLFLYIHLFHTIWFLLLLLFISKLNFI